MEEGRTDSPGTEVQEAGLREGVSKRLKKVPVGTSTPRS